MEQQEEGREEDEDDDGGEEEEEEEESRSVIPEVSLTSFAISSADGVLVGDCDRARYKYCAHSVL